MRVSVLRKMKERNGEVVKIKERNREAKKRKRAVGLWECEWEWFGLLIKNHWNGSWIALYIEAITPIFTTRKKNIIQQVLLQQKKIIDVIYILLHL